ncbi:GspH/FimT family pseudopilin [Variovorax sp. HJSM1_2]|uniref:GspH/FimT family pseudopilin n=1 Tax=Variovorax sp. HJSM1_2 TaxID=3366263 RepID=UPI003BC1A84B
MIRPTTPASRLCRNRHSGFTLLEVLVTVAIAGILAALAAPSLRDFVARNKMSSIGNEFTGSVLRARNEAVSRNTCVTMCLSTTVNDTGTGSSGPRCATTGQDWQVGWIAFLNPSCSSASNNPDADKPENLLFVRQPVAGEYYLNALSNTRKIQFNNRGLNGLGSAEEFDLVYQSVNHPWTQKYGFNICLNKMGRTRTISDASTCGSDSN